MPFRVAGYLALAGALATAGPASSVNVGQGATCGQPGLPPCPLQSFMRNQVAASLARGDMKGMAEALRKVATLAPPEFTTWSQLANDGARAAELGDRRALRATCNGCHQAWRQAYRERFRERPL
jgi:hypothetical protein